MPIGMFTGRRSPLPRRCHTRGLVLDAPQLTCRSVGFALVVTTLLAGIGPARSMIALLDLPDKQFFVTDTLFIYSDFSTACQVSGLDVGIIDTNNQYYMVQAALWHKIDIADKGIWLYVNRTREADGFSYWWADEEVSGVLWWATEPNRYSHRTREQNYAECDGYSPVCRPVQMVSAYVRKDKITPPYLRDTCCWRESRGLCMQDVNECLNPTSNNCTANSVCTNLNYSYTCECQAGYQEINGECYDIDECISSLPTAPCPFNRTCVNTNGSYACLCQTGFTDNANGDCQDIDECTDLAGSPCPPNRPCVNTPGGYHCTDDQWNFSDQLTTAATYPTSTDTDECADPANHQCPAFSSCIDTPGSYVCICNQGYYKDVDGICQDVDECGEQVTPLCPAQSACNNTAGGYICGCLQGYQLDMNGSCLDVDECVDPANHQCPARSSCNNTAGSYICLCDDGFYTDVNETCQDINECVESAQDLCPSDTLCSNTDGGFTCIAADEPEVPPITSALQCPCVCEANVRDFSNHLEHSLRDFRRRLLINTRNLSSHVRQLRSAKDSRSSSVSMGTFAIAVLVSFFAIVMGTDVIDSWLFIRRRITCLNRGLN